MGVVISPVGWRLNVLKYWNFYIWSNTANYSFLAHRFNNFIDILKFYLNNKAQSVLRKDKEKLNIRFVNIRVLQFNNKLIILIFFETFTNKVEGQPAIIGKQKNKEFLSKFKISTDNKGGDPSSQLQKIKQKKKINRIKNAKVRGLFFGERSAFFKEGNNYFFKEEGFNELSSESIRFFSKRPYLPRNYYSFLTKESLVKYKETLDSFDKSFIWEFLDKATFSKEPSLAELRINKKLSSFFYLLCLSKGVVSSSLKKNNYFFNKLKRDTPINYRFREFNFLNLKNLDLERKINRVFFFFPFFLFLKKLIIRRFKKYISSSDKNLNLGVYFVQNNYSDINIKYIIDWFLDETLKKKKKFKRTLTSVIKALHFLVDSGLLRGYQLQIVGRITKKDRALYIWKRHLNVSLTAKVKKINYYEETFITKFSTCSLKIWIEKF